MLIILAAFFATGQSGNTLLCSLVLSLPSLSSLTEHLQSLSVLFVEVIKGSGHNRGLEAKTFNSLEARKQSERREEVHQKLRFQILNILTNTVFQYWGCGLILLNSSEKLLLL